MKRTERDAIEELAQLLDGGLSADDAVAPVRRLATLAASITETETVERPSPAFRAALRNQLVADIEASEVTSLDRARDAVWVRTARVRHSARAAVASAVAAGMLGSAGVAAAAQHALPGDALYGVKRVTESVRLSLASGLREEAQVQLRLAEERLEELRDGSERLGTDEVVDTLDRMDAASLRGSAALIQAVTDGEDAAVLQDLVAFTDRQRQGLIEVYDRLPVDARPFADASLEVLRRIDVEVTTTVGPCAACEHIASGAVVSSLTPGDGVVSRECDCISPDAVPPPRDPGVTAPGAVVPSTGSPSTDDDGGDGSTDAGVSDPPDVAATLPEPLGEIVDGVGDVVDETVDGVEDTVGQVPTVAPTDPTGTVEDTVEDLGGLLDPTP